MPTVRTEASHRSAAAATYAFARSLPRRIAGVSAMLLTWQQRASERSRLASLSDHHLKDMGLSRADVAQEVNKPFWIA